MIIDCHTHIFPKDIKDKREAYFQGENEFSLLYKNPESKISTYSDLLKSMDQNSIEKSIVFGFRWNNSEKAKFHNDYVFEAYIKYPDRFIPFACFNPVCEYAFEEARRCIKSGFRGFGELGIYSSDFTCKNLEKITPVMELASYLDVPLIFHTNEPCGHLYPGKAPVSIKGISDFTQRFKNNRIILAHLGGGFPFFSLLKKPPVMENILFDTAALPFLYKKNIYEVLEKMGMENKIVFGSDWPLISPARYLKEIDDNDISEKFKTGILYNNILNFLGT